LNADNRRYADALIAFIGRLYDHWYHRITPLKGGLKLQEWTLHEWTMKEEITGPDITGVDNDGVILRGLF